MCICVLLCCVLCPVTDVDAATAAAAVAAAAGCLRHYKCDNQDNYHADEQTETSTFYVI